jgi:hypothetical protein
MVVRGPGAHRVFSRRLSGSLCIRFQVPWGILHRLEPYQRGGRSAAGHAGVHQRGLLWVSAMGPRLHQVGSVPAASAPSVHPTEVSDCDASTME